MRLHELRLNAIGPFLDEQVIDFDRLGAGGLFLLEGPTGAGKSTVLDAVTFALYGSVTGAASDARRLTSDFAPFGTTPQVQLQLSVRGRRLRITRSPEHDRPKRRGDGVIRERSTVHLQQWQDGAWTSLAHRQDEVGTMVGDLLGLTREQFRQVVLLPQGEFATFLRADDDGRRAVLVKLFGTQFYERLARILQEQAAGVRAKVRDSETELHAFISAAWEASGRRPEDDPDRPLTWAQQVSDVTSVGELAERAAGAAALASDEASRAEAAARLVAVEAGDMVARVVERDGLMMQVGALEAQRTEQERRVMRLDRARQARPVRPLVKLLGETRSKVARTLVTLTSVGLVAAAQGAATHAVQLRDEASDAERTIAGLRHLVAREAAIPAIEAELTEAMNRVALEQRQNEQLLTELATLPKQLEEVAAQSHVARAAEVAGERATRELEQAKRRRRAAVDAAELQARIAELREQERAARRLHEEARDNVGVVVELRLAGMQGQLAAQLVSGDPCLVCGSVEHPAPASARQSGVSEDQLHEAEQARDKAWAAWESVAGALRTTEAGHAAQVALADGLDAEQADGLLAELVATESAGKGASRELARLAGEEKQLRQSETSLQGKLVAAASGLATANADVTRHRTDLTAAHAEIADELGDYATVLARSAALRATAVRALAGAHALAEHAEAQQGAASALRAALVAAAAAGFADLDEAQEWMLDDVALAELERAVREWDRRFESASERLGAQHLAAVADITTPRAQAVSATAHELLGEATRRARARADQAARTEHTAELLDRLLVGVQEAAEKRAALAESAAALTAVDDYMRGQAGSPRMTLSTFVLRYWFEQVVAAANVRLATMSSGKYQLSRVERGAKASSRVGLGLAILDRHTGRERGTETLSGGETFYTSLSLALGLADVVVAEAGGAALDTLFIDEGFGTLDATTLDEVMVVIDELRGHGRLVGVVSHVAELKERIPERLSIRRVRGDGPSRITVVA